MLIRTHFVRWYDGCARWVWDYLTPEQWGRLRHISYALLLGPCIGGPPVAILITPSPIQETVNPHSPRSGLPEQKPAEADYGPSADADILRAVHYYRDAVRGDVVATPEPGTLVVLLTAVGGALVFRRRRQRAA